MKNISIELEKARKTENEKTMFAYLNNVCGCWGRESRFDHKLRIIRNWHIWMFQYDEQSETLHILVRVNDHFERLAKVRKTRENQDNFDLYCLIEKKMTETYRKLNNAGLYTIEGRF